MEDGMARRLSVIGVPSSAGAFAPGQERAPRALREAGLVERLRSVCSDVQDLGDSPVVRWRPDRAYPRAQNLSSVVEQVRSTSLRVAAALGAGRTALVLGGDCTTGVGTLAGSREVLGPLGLIYFDLHADMNTPSSVPDGALDWTGVAHMLALDGCDPILASAVTAPPLLAPEDLVLFGHGAQEATPWELDQIARLQLKRVAVEEVEDDPTKAAQRALSLSEGRDRYIVHFDVDVIDFTDAPLSENAGRNKGLSFDTAMVALRGLLSSDKVAALTVTELNPEHARAEEGLLERFVDGLAQAWA
jgi:arginase